MKCPCPTCIDEADPRTARALALLEAVEELEAWLKVDWSRGLFPARDDDGFWVGLEVGVNAACSPYSVETLAAAIIAAGKWAKEQGDE